MAVNKEQPLFIKLIIFNLNLINIIKYILLFNIHTDYKIGNKFISIFYYNIIYI